MIPLYDIKKKQCFSQQSAGLLWEDSGVSWHRRAGHVGITLWTSKRKQPPKSHIHTHTHTHTHSLSLSHTHTHKNHHTPHRHTHTHTHRGCTPTLFPQLVIQHLQAFISDIQLSLGLLKQEGGHESRKEVRHSTIQPTA